MATAANAGPATQVQQDQQLGTVAGRTATLIDQNSPLMQRAAAKARIAANNRGLGNSSMAVGAGETAVLDAAVPIANADAASFNGIQQNNMAADNNMKVQNAGMLQQTELSNANAANTMEMKNTSDKLQAEQFSAQQENAMATTQAQIDADTSKFNAQQSNAIIINSLDQANKVELAGIQAAYNNDMQASATANGLFSSSMAAIDNIQRDSTMSAAAKQNAINQQVRMLKAGMNMAGSIAQLNLGATLNFAV